MKLPTLNKRGVANLGKEVVGFVSAGIAAAIGLIILAETKLSMTDAGGNASITYAAAGITNIVKFMGIIGLVIAAVYIISYLVGLKDSGQ